MYVYTTIHLAISLMLYLRLLLIFLCYTIVVITIFHKTFLTSQFLGTRILENKIPNQDL